ncbi:uncharacterized protein [Euphorbia lathyris]|uniref:uncharacterized protein n=1 Tax=Euphorbia lathyris TaxID=212925 RepID=UPI003313BC57
MEPNEYQSDLASKKSKIKRLQPFWRFFLISNLGLAAYMFVIRSQKNMNVRNNRSAKKDVEESKAPEEDLSDFTLPDPEISSPPPPTILKVKKPIPEDQQLELFKWMLEEKRKVKPNDPEEKKRIDEDKAILKQFIRTDTTPKL